MVKRIMGLDVGDKWIGVAVSDETALIASSISPLRRSSWDNDLARLKGVVSEWNVGQIVVGLPLNMDSTVGPQAQKTLAFMERLAHNVSVPVVSWDERLTTRQAERLLIDQGVRRDERRTRVDGVAAALILQGYLDHQRVVGTREETHMADDKDLETGVIGEDEDEIITLTDEDGVEHEFVVVDVIEVSDKEYAILLPLDADDEEEAEAVILRLEKDSDGDDVLVDIESEEEWEQVAQAYEELLDDEEE